MGFDTLFQLLVIAVSTAVLVAMDLIPYLPPTWTPMNLVVGTITLLYISQVKSKIMRKGDVCIPDPTAITAIVMNINVLLGLCLWLVEAWFDIQCFSVEKVKVKSRKNETMVTGVRYSHPGLNNIRCHSLSGFFSAFQIHLVSVTLEAQYIGQPNFNETPLDEYKGLLECDEVLNDVVSTWDVQTFLVWVAIAALSAVHGGIAGPMIVMSAYMLFRDTRPEVKKAVYDSAYPNMEGIKAADGLYRVTANPMGIPLHRGIGYLQKGVFYTRFHVTNGCPLTFNETITYSPAYINASSDTVTYGGSPSFVKTLDGEEVTAAVACSTSNAIILYKSIVSVDDNGMMVFRGNRSTPGTSGSPFFKRVTTQIVTDFGTEMKVEYKIAGTLGWSYTPMDTPKSSVELYQENATKGTVNIQITDNDIVQIFSHPGSGKTRNIMPNLLTEGLAKYGKVYITGPTRVVCHELYESLLESMPGQVALLTSDADAMTRGTSARPIIISAHATMLSMLIRGSSVTSSRGLWIMDESHFQQSTSMMLKDFLRDHVKHKHRGALVEMTATGYNIRSRSMEIKTGSNFPIEDVSMSVKDMVTDMIAKAANSKVVCFVTATRGKSITTSASLKRQAQSAGIPFVELSRLTFNKAYTEAKAMELGLVLTTDISECGINLNVDHVYDFQSSAKTIKHMAVVSNEMRAIDEAQRTQRRGRVGRRKPGRYVYPNDITVMDEDATRVEHYDRQVFANTYGIEIMDPIPVGALTRDSLTPPQLLYWLCGGESSLNGVGTVNLFITPTGKLRSREALYEAARIWIQEGNVSIKIGETTLSTLTFWDERDRSRLEALLKERGQITTLTNAESTTTMARLFHTLSNIRGTILGAPEPQVVEDPIDVSARSAADEEGEM